VTNCAVRINSSLEFQAGMPSGKSDIRMVGYSM
jgi:hypothetical protein